MPPVVMDHFTISVARPDVGLSSDSDQTRIVQDGRTVPRATRVQRSYGASLLVDIIASYRPQISFSHGAEWKALIRRYIGTIPLSGDIPCAAEDIMSALPPDT